MQKRARRFKRCCKWCCRKIYQFLDFLFSFMEVHLIKISAFAIMCLCCGMVNAFHMIVVVMLLMCLVFGMSALKFSFSFISLYLSILFLTKMAYQTDLVPDLRQKVNCSNVSAKFQTTVTNTVLDPEWWGFEFLNGRPLASYYKGYVLVFFVMTLQTVIRIRQKMVRIDAGFPPDTPDVVFPNTTRTDADKSLTNCFKFLIDYGFYKFGIEVTLSYCVFSVTFREDVFAVLYGVWVFILVLPKRTTLAIMWPFFFTTVLFSILWQYVMAVGLSKKTCFQYPWDQQEALIKWMFLPNFKYKPNTNKILGIYLFFFTLLGFTGEGWRGLPGKYFLLAVDFVLLILIQRQQSVFELEKRFGDRYSGGSNKEDYNKFKDPYFVNPTPDHTLGVKSWIDLAKFVFMTWYFRITLGFLFWNGASNVNVLSLGYLVAAFIFLWIDYDLCLWPIEKILKWWNILLMYTTTVILAKAVLEFIGCIYGDYLEKNLSFLIGLFWVHCCILTPNHSFDWDVVCFICIVFQRRYFKSSYFLHEVNDVRTIFKLQARGAKLMDELQELRLLEFQERERRTMMKIKKCMNRIKAWQKRMQGLNYIEPSDHATAIYMGDYFMFEDLDKKVELSSSSSSEEDEKDKSRKSTVQKREDKSESESSDEKPEKSTEDIREEENEKLEKEKAGKGTKTAREILVIVLVYIIEVLNKNSEDYRYVQSKIGEEKRKQKASTYPESPSQPVLKAFQVKSHGSDVQDIDYYYRHSLQKIFVQLLIALSKFFMSKTELLCYLCIFLHTTLAPSMISLTLPILVLLWGSLTSIRPTTTFWTVLIAYTEVTVVIKAIFQNSVFPWNATVKKPIHYESPPLFLGIHKDKKFVLADLFLLILLFLHRYKLKTLGLWNRAHEEQTFLPDDFKIYKELSSEGHLKAIKGNRSLVYQRKMLAGTSFTSPSMTTFLQTALWKCTSRTTAKYVYRRDKLRAKILVKEIEGPVLVTHDGRRLLPTDMYITNSPEEDLEGNVVLRVYTQDFVAESKTLPYRLSWIQHFTSIRKFFHQILVREWRVSFDFYTLMFIFQFINFLIIFFWYSSFANPDDLQSDDYFSLTENQVPLMYLFTIVFHFMIIITDRILYLRKVVIGKLILHFVQVILVHSWMFIAIPVVTESSFSHLAVRQMYYLVSCLYFLMSAYQLRVGYPMRVQGHFLSKKYGYFNFFAYKCLQLLPFFNQLRTLLDYLCTHTSLTMMEWIKMESIFQVVFESKCSRRADIYHPATRGEECPKLLKYCPGVASFSAIVILIWLPFFVFVVFNSVANPNLPQEAKLEMYIGYFGEIYKTEVMFNDIIAFTEGQYTTLQRLYKDSKKIWTFLSLYDHRDVAVLKFRFESFRPWFITPIALSLLNETIQNLDNPIRIYIIWEVRRDPKSHIVGYGRGNSEIILTKNNEARRQLADAFLKKGNKIRLDNVLPKFLRVTNEGKAKPLSGFMTPGNAKFRNVTISLTVNETYLRWKLEELADDPNEDRISKVPFQNKDEITMYTFNEKTTPKLLLNIRKKGIIGLYLSIVLVTWTFIRRIMTTYPRIMFVELPNPDPVLQLLNDIYLARESHEFALEEDLFAKLLFLYRSPETMIKVTRLTDLQVRLQRS